MIEGPIGGAAFNNEFGRPACAATSAPSSRRSTGAAAEVRGYHKPIMIAGGMGNIRAEHVQKRPDHGGRQADRARRARPC
jgi:phosphoribosylformylglycinamidine synthase